MEHTDELWCYYSDLPSVMAYDTPKEKKYPDNVKLRPDYKSLRRCTYSQYQEQNKLGWMMTM
jgi:hypothetical protein